MRNWHSGSRSGGFPSIGRNARPYLCCRPPRTACAVAPARTSAASCASRAEAIDSAGAGEDHTALEIGSPETWIRRHIGCVSCCACLHAIGFRCLRWRPLYR